MNKSEQLIACLEGEIAKRDARILELESQYQRDVFGLNNEGDPIGGDPAGGYANDNARLRTELAAIRAQEPVAIEFRQFMTAVVTGAGLLSCGKQSKGLAAELSATAYKYLLGAPVSEAKAQVESFKPEELRIDTYNAGEHSGFLHTNETAVRITHLPTGAYVESKDERSVHRNKQKCLDMLPAAIEAKAQGVVMLPSVAEVMNIVFDYQHNKNKNVTGTTNWAANIGMAVIDAVVRLNAAPAAPAAEACKACKGTGRRPIGGRGRIFGLTNRCFECQPLTDEEVYGQVTAHE